MPVSSESGICTQTLAPAGSDSLIIGGVYKIILTDGRVINGEFMGYSNSGLCIEIDDEFCVFKKEEITSIETAVLITDKKNVKNENRYNHKFKILGSVQTGLSIPSGILGDYYSTSSGFQISYYKILGKATGYGCEFQYNHFHGPPAQYQVFQYENIKTERGNYNSSTLKMNFIFGNLNPESIIVFYGLFGVGLQYNHEGQLITTYIYSNSEQEIISDGYTGTTLMFGGGAGTFVKISRYIGINLEFQYNKLTAPDYKQNEYQVNSNYGIYTVKAGVMYTGF